MRVRCVRQLRSGADRTLWTTKRARQRLSVVRAREEEGALGAPGLARGARNQIELALAAIADLRLAAWFLWMTPLDTALSSARVAA